MAMLPASSGKKHAKVAVSVRSDLPDILEKFLSHLRQIAFSFRLLKYLQWLRVIIVRQKVTASVASEISEIERLVPCRSLSPRSLDIRICFIRPGQRPDILGIQKDSEDTSDD